MRIIHLTDLHIGKAGEDTRGVDVRANFQALLASIRSLKPDHIIITGDLCYREGNLDIYRWIKLQLDHNKIPYDVIAGNHDDSALLAVAFEQTAFLQDGTLFFLRDLHGQRLLFLDTATDALSLAQQVWLQAQLQESTRLTFIWMHHPPLLADVPYMDMHYPLHNWEAVQAILLAHPGPIHVFCGHYHVEKTIQQNGLHVHITPSTFFQLDPFRSDFAVDHHRPGFRIVDVANETVRHTVRYLNR
ncbi:MAG TPA: metallophosphoesterase [Saprospiraceae bacterium]|nr:metallophosphoesterase [Saprospiraceae bacterium]HMP13416.1 metallophosphoesterase [Saprospiraceae bacterium]